MMHLESKLQISCVEWFRYQPAYKRYLLYAIPNGGKRSKIEAKIMKSEGVTRGVADLCLQVPSQSFHALYIEIKIEKGNQSESQKEFQKYCESNNYKYVVCRTLQEFIFSIQCYLGYGV